MDTQFDRLLDRFEDELKAGNSPRIERYLSEWLESAGQAMLLELVSLDVYYRTRSGQPIESSDYEHFGRAASDQAEKALLKNTKQSSFSPRTIPESE